MRVYAGAVSFLAVWVAGMPEGAGADPQRQMAYTRGTAEEAQAWQAELRAQFAQLLAIDDLVEGEPVPFEEEIVAEEARNGYTFRDITFQSTPGRRIEAVVTVPEGEGPFPAVIGVHGHSGDRFSVYDAKAQDHAHIYKEFGRVLAERGYITIAVGVGQHEVLEDGRTLMGERLWDLMRCVDYVAALPQADAQRIGCAGLSLGGEMTMWLGAMDERIAATVSAGFLTVMDQMEQNHCMCWKFDGLRERVDFADLYAMIAPRPLQCQNGVQEPETQFTVALARNAIREVQPAYLDFGAPEHCELVVHPGGHEIALDPLLAFFERHLGR